MKKFIQQSKLALVILSLFIGLIVPKTAYAYPVFAQQAYESPREATGRIVCANCHLAQKLTEVEAPQAVLPDSVFDVVVDVPYDLSSQQVTAAGTKGGLNVGAVVVLPEGFTLAPKDRLSDELKAKTKGVFISPYSKTKPNILVVGPIDGSKNQQINFPVLSPDPGVDKNVNYLNYPIYVGANRGRGQVYPSGEKSNNNLVTSTVAGQVTTIEEGSNGATNVIIQTTSGDSVTQTIPKGLQAAVTTGTTVKVDQALTYDPNVGGFGQAETEIVLQDANRIYGYLAFSISVILTQTFLVVKKKQFEKVQAAEIDF